LGRFLGWFSYFILPCRRMSSSHHWQ